MSWFPRPAPAPGHHHTIVLTPCIYVLWLILHLLNVSVLPRRKMKTVSTSHNNILRTKIRGVKFWSLLRRKYVNGKFLKTVLLRRGVHGHFLRPCSCNLHLYRLALKAIRKRKPTTYNSISFFKKTYWFIFREKEREGEREGETQECVVASHAPPTGDLACNPGLCPDWESNQQPFGLQVCAQSTELHQPGRDSISH